MPLLAIDGDLSIPRTFSFDDLRLLPEQEAEPSLLLGGRVIRAVRLSAIVAALGIKPWARVAVVRGRDGYRANIPLDALDDTVLVYAVGERPLPAELGGPLRLLARGLGNCANVRAVEAISFAVEPVIVENACAHEHARARRLRAS
jgi:DMSO/TMAO reductase YedYZ molybdopterin-dependent catalytic subunit